MKTNGPGKGRGSAPVCWWCKASIALDCPWRGHEPSVVVLPVGVVVCGEGCKKRPEGALVWYVKVPFISEISSQETVDVP